jgi:hypothetical protein
MEYEGNTYILLMSAAESWVRSSMYMAATNLVYQLCLERII